MPVRRSGCLAEIRKLSLPVQYTAPPRTSSVTVRTSPGPARVASHRAPQSQAPTRATIRDVSTTDRRFEGCESSNATNSESEQGGDIPTHRSSRSSEVGEAVLPPPNTPSAGPQLSSFMDSNKRSESHSLHAAVARGDRRSSADAAFLWATP